MLSLERQAWRRMWTNTTQQGMNLSLALQTPAGVITHGVSTTPSGGTLTGATATVPMSTTDGRHTTANGAAAATVSFRRPVDGEEFHPAVVRVRA